MTIESFTDVDLISEGEVMRSLLALNSVSERAGSALRLVLSSIKDQTILKCIQCGESFDGFCKEKGLSEEAINFLNRMLRGDGLYTIFPPDRRQEIIRQFIFDYPHFAEWRIATQRQELHGIPEEELSMAQWTTVATTPPCVLKYENGEMAQVKMSQLREQGIKFESQIKDGHITITIFGHRVSFAWHKPPCVYSQTKTRGCRYCVLHADNAQVRQVTLEQQLAALEDGLARISTIMPNPTVFEFLPDGNFLNPAEVNPKTQNELLQRIGRELSVHRVAFESRIEYCTTENIKRCLSQLRADQTMELYVGAESSDEVVAGLLHNKGYGFAEFRERIIEIARDLSLEEKERVHFTTYHIVKPIYVTESEAIDLALQTARDVKQLSEEIGMSIEVKYEPCIISSGSAQDYGYHHRDIERNRLYTPLSYFSVAELVARLSEENLENRVKFGQHDDIDHYTVVANSPIDFRVYNAVQRFNSTRDFRGFCVDMQPVIDFEEFTVWEKQFYSEEGKSSLSRLIRRKFSEIATDEEEKQRQRFQDKIGEVCRVFATQAQVDLSLSEQINFGILVKKMQNVLKEHGISTVLVQTPRLIDPAQKMPGEAEYLSSKVLGLHSDFGNCTVGANIQLEVIIQNEEGAPQSVWMRIPFLS
ncbi:MAG: hypothetical protein UT55_C0085G0004 [Candidatus Peregrinibacteria bacterium GW2011_GWE2_39_6]|nr:MAG: hypothetical protein UT36_C0005G0070 [Candidatus Peregrinibacteria bacterium GW2011_GWF2_39_17]KKR23679.1 MAG: hypothetical protein UT55_C0085G0004 [Candidatus Peregrinibacteria bacterium GW2011_GWE2_39_6]HCW32905.1 hypothetical protein [Candidatus Peregrinibacteria bacterium]